jgi:hypothetical protein
MLIGFLAVYGAVGGMDAGPSEYFAYQFAAAVIGLFVMYSGVRAMNRYE